MPTNLQVAPVSSKALWAGRVINGPAVPFVAFDGAIKLTPLL